MLDKTQYKKAEKKIDIIKDIINSLISYNNINNYYNQKTFIVKFNYNYDSINNCYIYDININRGSDNPQNILKMKIQYKDKIDNLIIDLINEITNNNYLNYTSFKTENNTYYKYILNYKNNIIVEFPINDNNDKILYENINNKFNINTIKNSFNKKNINSNDKDRIQTIKCLKKLNIIENIITKISELNNIENYDNIKPYKLTITLEKINDYYKYNFYITKDNKNKITLLDFSISIKNNKFIENKINELLLNLTKKPNYLYSSINENKNLTLKFNNLIDIELKNYTETNLFSALNNNNENIKKLKLYK